MDGPAPQAVPPGSTRQPSLGSAIHHALRRNLIPGMVLWFVAVGCVLAFYFLPAARPAFDAIADWQVRYGWIFSSLLMVVASGLIPAVVAQILGTPQPAPWRRQLPFLIILWGQQGVQIHLLYTFLDWWIGPSESIANVAAKVAFDQGIMAPFWFVPILTIAYRWRDGGLTRSAWCRIWRPDLPRHVIIAVVTNGLIWIPGVTCIYSLPLPLQVPLSGCVGCFYILLLQVLSAQGETD